MRLDQTYDPIEIEELWYPFWEQSGFFRANAASDKPPYTIVIPPPNVTGSLHMGHATFVTLQDMLVRWRRMQGYETLWLPGTDHAGIATQVVVERLLKKEGTDRHALGREEFLKRVWQWKEESGGRIIHQLRRMGASCDWERERFTMDPQLSRAVVEIFVRMYDDGLIYRGDRMVNWDPVTQTVLSDLEVDSEEEPGKFWTLRYPLADGSGHIMVGTTRPETMLGDAAVAVHPDDERYQHLIGKMIRLPLVDREIPIIADGILADPTKGTGAVKVTPAHDPNDYECGIRHGLPLTQVIGLDARMIAPSPERFIGLDRYEARAKVVAEFDALGLLDKVEDRPFSPGRSERSGVIVEPLVLKQWFVKGEPLAKPAIEAVETGRTQIIPEGWKKTWDHFMYNIRDWCISRQLWWGHQIPAWYGPDGTFFVARTEAEAQAQADAHYGQEGTAIQRDPDVLDTWFSSGLWPFSTLGWPDKTPELDKFYPTQVLETGFDILFFWVARMMMMGIYAMGDVPFEKVFLHAMVRDREGNKMSKVKGNVIDPLHMIYGAKADELDPEMHRELIKQYPEGVRSQGADALRFTLAIFAAQGRDIKLDVSRMEGYRAFLNKLWNASKFTLMNMEGYAPAAWTQHTEQWDASNPPPFAEADLSAADRWILIRASQAIAEVTRAFEEFKFNEAAQALYHFVWHQYCDWYIELVKPTLYDRSEENAASRAATQHTLMWVLDTILRLIHPISPFISEDIWQALPRAEGAPASIMIASFPIARPELQSAAYQDAAVGCELAIGIIEQVRSIRASSRIKPGVVIPRLILIAPVELHAALSASTPYIARQAKVEAMELHADESGLALGQVATAVVSGVQLRIPMAGLIDIAEETARIQKEIARVIADIAFVEKKLGNEKFIAKAPAELVAEQREKLAGFLVEREALERSLSELTA
jgi:valyl-tRNA synthetase